MEPIGSDAWWRDIFFKIESRDHLSREETRTVWNLLWESWVEIDLRFLKWRFLPQRLRSLLAMRKINPVMAMAAPAFLVGLAAKGLTKEELAGLTDSFHDHEWFADYMELDVPYPNTVYSNGFGGDAISTVNVSTASMIIAAAANTPVYKMGSRSYYSKAGSHDFLSMVGVRAATDPLSTIQLIEQVGVAYIDGVSTADPRTQALGEAMSIIPNANQTIKAFFYPFRFPILCLNPLRPKRLQRGVSTLDTEVVAETLSEYYPYIELAQVTAGMDDSGRIIDEVSNVGITQISEIQNGRVRTFTTTPEDWGVPRSNPSEIVGGTAQENARIILEVFQGSRRDAHRDLLLINASQYLYLAGLTEDFRGGTEIARKVVESGAAMKKLKEFADASGGSVARIDKVLD